SGPGLDGQMVGHLVQPAGEGRLLADSGSLAGQHQEGGLESVLGIMPMTQLAAADIPDHRPVPLYQLGKGGFVTAGGKAFEKLAVGQPGRGFGSEFPPEMPQKEAQGYARHGSAPERRVVSSLNRGRGRTDVPVNF